MDTPPVSTTQAAQPASPPNRYAFFIDGFNLYHAIAGPRRATVHQYREFKWLNTQKLCSIYTPASATLTKVMHFTALTNWDQDKMARHKLYVRALEYAGVEVVYGKFKRRTRDCQAVCQREYTTWEEKETDVNIAVNIFKAAMSDEFDTAVMVTGDSDQLPIIRAIREAFPQKRLGLIIPPGRSAEELKREVDFHSKMKTQQIKSALFPRRIDLGGGTFLNCPQEWMPSSFNLPTTL